jgi:hypothetical protein
VATAGAIERTADVFADILCADPEWVELEFEEIIAGLRDAPRSAPTPPWPMPHGPSAEGRDHRPHLHGARRSRTEASIRSPPRSAAHSGAHRPERRH